MANTQARTLATGVPGWLGSRLVEVLCNGDQDIGHFAKYPERLVRCLVLPGSDSSRLERLPLELVVGDIRDPNALGLARQAGAHYWLRVT